MSGYSVSKLLKLSSYFQRKYSIKESGGLVRSAEFRIDENSFYGSSRALILYRQERKRLRQEIKGYFDAIAVEDRQILALLEKAYVRCGSKTASGKAIKQYIHYEYKDIMTQLYADGMRNLCSDKTKDFVGVRASEIEAVDPLRQAMGKWRLIWARLSEIHKNIATGSESRDMSNVDKTKSSLFALEIGYKFEVLNDQEMKYLEDRCISIEKISAKIMATFDKVSENEEKIYDMEMVQNSARSRHLADARRKDLPESNSGEVWVAPPGAPKPTKEQQGPGFFDKAKEIVMGGKMMATVPGMMTSAVLYILNNYSLFSADVVERAKALAKSLGIRRLARHQVNSIRKLSAAKHLQKKGQSSTPIITLSGEDIVKLIKASRDFMEVMDKVVSQVHIPDEIVQGAKRVCEVVIRQIKELLSTDPAVAKQHIADMVELMDAARRIVNIFVSDQDIKRTINRCTDTAKEVLGKLNQMF